MNFNAEDFREWTSTGLIAALVLTVIRHLPALVTAFVGMGKDIASVKELLRLMVGLEPTREITGVHHAAPTEAGEGEAGEGEAGDGTPTRPNGRYSVRTPPRGNPER